MKKQNDCIDILKIVMALFVVAIHANLFNGALFPTIRIAVPVFFVLSGFFTFSRINSVDSIAEKNRKFWKIERRYLTLYLFWFFVLLPVTLYVRKYYRYQVTQAILLFVKQLVFGSTFQASWYLMACVIGNIIVFALSKVSSKALIIVSVVTYIFATVSSKYEIVICNNDKLNSIYTTVTCWLGSPYNNFLISIPYIMIGKMIAEGKFSIVGKGRSFVCFVICYLGLIGEYLFSKNRSWFIYSCDCWFMLAPAALFLVLFVMEQRISFEYARIMRVTSTVMYCSHLAILMIVNKSLSILKVSDPHRLIAFVSTLVFTQVLTLIILELEKKDLFKFLKYSH